MSTIELKAYDVYFDKTAQNKIAQKKDILLTKDDKIELIKEIKETKADMIKWMVILILPLYLLILGLIITLLFKK